jgi:hypothetical protein
MSLSIVITIRIEICGVSKMGNPWVKNLSLSVDKDMVLLQRLEPSKKSRASFKLCTGLFLQKQ